MREHFNFRKNNLAFELRKWPKKHQFCIEQCSGLNVGEILYRIPYENACSLRPRTPPGFPRLKVVPGRGGIFIKWWFECPGCGKKRENLYIPPNGQSGDWRCRKCHSLIYASQRFGPRNSLRKTLTPRKKRTKQKEAIRQNRIFARQEAKQQNRIDEVDPLLSKEKMIPFLREFRHFIDSGKSLVIEVPRLHPTGPSNPAQNDLEEQLEELRAECLPIVKNLAENGTSKRIRSDARKLLERESRRHEIEIVCEPKKPKTIPPAPSISLTADQIDRFKKVLAELPEEDLRF